MELKLKRRYKGDGYTIGMLTVDGKYFCDTLENTDRGLDQSMTEANIRHIKVKGATAIPTGTYRIDMATKSPRFKARWWARQFGGIVPRLVGVKGFVGVLIHPGNTADDTDGCILCGENKVKGQVVNSAATYVRLVNAMLDALVRGETITITIQ